MSSILSPRHLAIHGHFYQPPRGNPLSGRPLIEPNAAPYENWNARITAECYEPNARLGNLDSISYNVGETLAAWLEEHAPETYARFLEADRNGLAAFGAGNAIAQPMHHTILPLDRYTDKMTQVRWGKTVFQHRFGRRTTGMWLPEMAVDYETLEVLATQEIEWTILSRSQIATETTDSGPFWVKLPSGKRMKVFVRDEALSNDIAFNLGNFGGAGRWAREVLLERTQSAGPLTLIATDGETFGHHWKGEELFLQWLLRYEAQAAGYQITTLPAYASQAQPAGEIEIIENTAWSSSYGLARWVTGSADTAGDSSWKGAVRRALDNLRHVVDVIYRDETQRMNVSDPLALRDAFIKVVLGHTPPEAFLKEQEVDVSPDDQARLYRLVEAQYFRQRMYASCTFFYADIDDLSTRYGIASAAGVIRLIQDAVGDDLSSDFRTDLRLAHGTDKDTNTTITGRDIYDDIVSELQPGLEHRV